MCLDLVNFNRVWFYQVQLQSLFFGRGGHFPQRNTLLYLSLRPHPHNLICLNVLSVLNPANGFRLEALTQMSPACVTMTVKLPESVRKSSTQPVHPLCIISFYYYYFVSWGKKTQKDTCSPDPPSRSTCDEVSKWKQPAPEWKIIQRDATVDWCCALTSDSDRSARRHRGPTAPLVVLGVWN